MNFLVKTTIQIDLIGFAWSCGDKLYATDKLELLQDPILKEFLEKTPLKV